MANNSPKKLPTLRPVPSEQSEPPPSWAVLMRSLFDRMPDAVAKVRERYLRPDGSIFWPQAQQIERGVIDGLDDTYEGFHSWPLAYLLGADERLFHWGTDGFDAVTRQFASIPTGLGHPMVVNEYEQAYDWFHQGEGYLLFYNLCAADPTGTDNRRRASKFAGFLLNEDVPNPNYDFETRQFRSPHIGSMGPGFRNFTHLAPDYLRIRTYYGLPFQQFPGLTDPETYFQSEDKRDRYTKLVLERLSRGDVATNLAATSMALNAFLLTGETRFRDWVLDYIDGWMERAEANGGIIPDNVGLSGKVGEYLDGDWFGGHYGWTWPHGWSNLGVAVTVAMQNAICLTGDPKYPAFLRRHLELLAERAIELDGTLHFPYKHGNPGWYGYSTAIPMLSQVLRDESGAILQRDGWFEFRPCDPKYPAWLWQMTDGEQDEDLLLRLRNHRPGSWHSEAWKEVKSANSKSLGGHEAAWCEYLRGKLPGYPDRILEYNHQQMDDRLAFIENDVEPVEKYSEAYLQRRNPVSAEGIFQLTTGGTLPVYNGGLIHTRLRYFDADLRRSGLPADTAALVEKIEPGGMNVRLVNLHRNESRRVILRAGFYGEHRFDACQPSDGTSFRTHQDDFPTSEILIELPPGCNVGLRLAMTRFVNLPSADLPDWQSAAIPSETQTL